MKPPLWVRKLIRPLIPDRVMARYRLHEHSRQVRVNVDVFLAADAGRAARRRWLLATPDTYRVRPLAALGAAPPARHLDDPGTPVEDGEVVTLGDPALAGDAARLLADPALAAGAAAEISGPRLVGRRRTEPAAGVRALAVRGEAWNEVGGAPSDHPLPALWDRLRGTGRPLGLVPRPAGTAPAHRRDRITAEPAIVFSLVPMHDVGGGSRGAQFAGAFVRRGRHVTHVALYGTAESVDLGLRHIHPRLEQVRFGDFDPPRYLARLGGARPLVVVEMPAPAVLDAVRALRRAGATVVYDLIDDWSDPALGGDWWRPGAEEDMVAAADVLAASAPDLAAALERFGRPVALVPNGVDADLFSAPAGEPPPDLPAGDGPIIGYHGTLQAAWLDWGSVARLAAARPEARLVMIGDDKGSRPALPPNVRFLGLKPQVEMPRYVARFDVGLVPFVVSEMTHAVSPLKVYEYLAAGVPVAAPPLRALTALDGVHTDPDLAEAVSAALAAPRPDAARARREHSWGARVESLLRAAGREPGPGEGPGPVIEVRPATHYPAASRSPGW